MTDFYLMDPGGNLTLLLTAESTEACTPAAANAVMALIPEAEQAGFLLPGDAECDVRLQMAGGEFCGNASLSAAAWLCMQEGLSAGDTRSVRIRASGAPDILTAQIRALGKSSFIGAIGMPKISSVSALRTGDPALPEIPLVSMPGICHAMVPESMGMDWAEAHIRAWCDALHADAMGVMLLDEAKDRITPIVYVPASGTLFHEHSCASGTAAVGAWLHALDGKAFRRSFTEPGGCLEIAVDESGAVTLTNRIALRHFGKA